MLDWRPTFSQNYDFWFSSPYQTTHCNISYLCFFYFNHNPVPLKRTFSCRRLPFMPHIQVVTSAYIKSLPPHTAPWGQAQSLLCSVPKFMEECTVTVATRIAGAPPHIKFCEAGSGFGKKKVHISNSAGTWCCFRKPSDKRTGYKIPRSDKLVT